jgi:hypothetical protein
LPHRNVDVSFLAGLKTNVFPQQGFSMASTCSAAQRSTVRVNQGHSLRLQEFAQNKATHEHTHVTLHEVLVGKFANLILNGSGLHLKFALEFFNFFQEYASVHCSEEHKPSRLSNTLIIMRLKILLAQ